MPMKTLKIVLAAAVLVFAAAGVRAEGAATQCTGRLLGVMLKTAGGQWVTAWEGDQPLDLLDSKTPWATIESKGKIPPGKYINIKLRISETFQVSGSDGPYMTQAGSRVVIGGSAPTIERLPGDILAYEESGPTWNTEKEGELTVHLNYDYEDKDDYIEISRNREFQEPLVITDKSLLRVSVSVNLKSSLQIVLPGTLALHIPKDKALVFSLPSKLSEMVIRVDTSSRYVKSPELKLEF